jgi:hypothetical protein
MAYSVVVNTEYRPMSALGSKRYLVRRSEMSASEGIVL